MTVEYNSKVATASFSGFLKLLARYATAFRLSFHWPKNVHLRKEDVQHEIGAMKKD